MKLNKIFAIALAALTLTACSDDDDNNFLGGVNTASGVTVEMGNSQFTTQESHTSRFDTAKLARKTCCDNMDFTILLPLMP